MSRIFTRVEKWASESGERANLVTMLICVAFIVMVLVVIGGIAALSLSHSAGSL